jgi:hypothetical protein
VAEQSQLSLLRSKTRLSRSIWLRSWKGIGLLNAAFRFQRARQAEAALYRIKEETMRHPTAGMAAVVAAIAIAVIAEPKFGSRAASNTVHVAAGTHTPETTETKIERAMSAGPPEIARSAKIVDKDAQGHRVVLREGSNGFTCMPGNPEVIGDPPMCADGASMQWAADFAAHKPKPTNTVPGITYMLAGATQRSDSDPYDKTSPPITVGPHWMIMWPFDAKATGLPTTHRDKGAYIMWAGSPYAHVHVMGRPEGN